MALRPVVCTLLCLLLTISLSATTGQSDRAREFLAATFGVVHEDLARIDAGRVYSRTLPVRHPREVATLGIVKISTAPERYVEKLSDIAAFKRTNDILQIGTFGTPPRPADLAGLTIESADLAALRDCRVSDCGVQLSAVAIERFRTGVNWRAPDATRQATDLLQRILAEYVAQYLERGSSAAMEYADSDHRLPLADEFESLVAADTVTWPRVPALRRHLLEFPAGRSSGAKDLIYWSKERVHRRPVISVTHLAVVPGEAHSPVDYAIGSRQIYAMHYFDASLGITLLVADRTAATPSTYVVYLNRTRIDLFGGMLGGVARQVVKGKARSLVAEQLDRVQRMPF